MVAAEYVRACSEDGEEKQTRSDDVEETLHLSRRSASILGCLDKLFVGLIHLDVSLLDIFLDLIKFLFLAEEMLIDISGKLLKVAHHTNSFINLFLSIFHQI